MNNKCLLLLKAQLGSEFVKKEHSKSRILTQIAICIIGIIVILYAFLLSYGLGSIGLAKVIPSYAVAITSILMLFFTAVKTNGVLFAYKEYDFLMALPIKTSTVIASRFMVMYILNIMLTAAVMLPMGIGYIIWEAPGLSFYSGWLLGILCVPLIPTTLAAMLGALIILFSSRFKYANAVVTLLSVITVVSVLVLSLSAGRLEDLDLDVTQIKSLGELLLVQIHRLYPPAQLYYDGIIKSHILPLLLFFGGSVLWYMIFIRLTAKVYKKLNTSLMTWHSHSNFRMTTLKASSQMTALWRKEIKRFFSSTIYCMNMGMGSLMCIIASAALMCISKDTLHQLYQSPGVYDIILRVLPFALGAVVSMTCTTCVSLSLEGKNLWIIRSLPIEDITIYKSKIRMNLSLQLPAVFIAAVAVNIRLPLSPLMRLMVFLTPVSCACFSSVFGMLINIRMPEYDFTSETALIKQSLPSMAGMFGGMLCGLVPAGLMILLRNVNAELAVLMITAVFFAGTFLLWNYVKHQKICV